MKLYDFQLAPNPRRVRMYLAEKGISVETAQVNLRAGEQFNAEFRAANPSMVLPALVLDDGTLITETMAICRYFEALQPNPPLFGRSPKEQAQIEMWSRRAELEGFYAVAESLRNSLERFADRAIPGPRNYAQIPALVERGKARAVAFLEDLDAALRGRQWLATSEFSVADITAFVVVEFAGWVEVAPTETQADLRRWREAVAARPSAKA